MAQALEHAFGNASLEPLTDADIERLCPAAYAEAPRDDVSSRYGFVSTIKLIQAMREQGFVPTQCNSYARRNPDDRGFTKHMIRFRPAGDNLKKLTKGDVVPQAVLVNSHDRSSQFQLFGGLWRLVCSNGLMVSDGPKVEPLIIRHTTSAVEGLVEATAKLIKQQRFVFEHVDAMRSTLLDESQALQFAMAALGLRPERAGSIEPAQLLTPRRVEDSPFDLWHVFNRVQENMMRGGQRGVTSNNRAIVTRGVTSVNADMAINAGMWHLAVEAIDKAKLSAIAAEKAPAKKASKPAGKASVPANPVEPPQALEIAGEAPQALIEPPAL